MSIADEFSKRCRARYRGRPNRVKLGRPVNLDIATSAWLTPRDGPVAAKLYTPSAQLPTRSCAARGVARLLDRRKQMRTRPTIAVFDDSRDTVEVLVEAFRANGIDAVGQLVTDDPGVERFVQEHQPDAIVFDVAPPYLDDLETLRRLRGSAFNGIPVFLTTTDPRCLASALRRGEVEAVFLKPYSVQDLADTIRRSLGGSEDTA